jgi:hypothetical protein
MEMAGNEWWEREGKYEARLKEGRELTAVTTLTDASDEHNENQTGTNQK